MQGGLLWKLRARRQQIKLFQLQNLFFPSLLQADAKMVRHHQPARVFCRAQCHAVFVQIAKRISGFSGFLKLQVVFRSAMVKCCYKFSMKQAAFSATISAL